MVWHLLWVAMQAVYIIYTTYRYRWYNAMPAHAAMSINRIWLVVITHTTARFWLIVSVFGWPAYLYQSSYSDYNFKRPASFANHTIRTTEAFKCPIRIIELMCIIILLVMQLYLYHIIIITWLYSSIYWRLGVNNPDNVALPWEALRATWSMMRLA